MSKFAKKGHLVVDADSGKMATVGDNTTPKSRKILEKAGLKEVKAEKTPKGLKQAEKTINKALKKVAKKEASEKSEDTRKIKVLVKENPKREGSDSFKRFALYSDKAIKTVADFIAAGGTSADVRYDAAKGYIQVA